MALGYFIEIGACKKYSGSAFPSEIFFLLFKSMLVFVGRKSVAKLKPVLCAWCLRKHYFLVDLIYRQGMKKGEKLTRKHVRQRDSWIKFLMKMFSAVCALNYNEGKHGKRKQGTGGVSSEAFDKSVFDKILAKETVRLRWSTHKCWAWKTCSRDCISLTANHCQPSNPFNHVLEIVWKTSGSDHASTNVI